MAPLLDNFQLRKASPRDQARILQKAAQEGPWRPVSEHLLEAVAAGSIAPNIFHIWLSVCKDVQAVVFALCQDTSALVRHVAIARFEKALRTDEGFPAAWDAIGGLSGVLNLMASMSVLEVASFCRALGQTGTAPAAASARQSAMSQLFGALNNRGPVTNPDKRPLTDYYQPLLLACKTDTAMQWHERRNQPLDVKTCRLHRAACQRKALQAMFAPAREDKREGCKRYQALFEQDKAFALEVLERLAEDEKALEKNEHDCISVLAIPLLRRIRQAPASDGHSRVEGALRLVLRCIQRRPEMKSTLQFHPNGIVACTIQAWVRARNRRAGIEEQLVQMLGSMRTDSSKSLQDIARLVAEVPPGLRYRLLKLLLLHAPGLRLDIDAPEKDLGAWSCSKLGRDSGSREGLWPRHLFHPVLPFNQSLQLFHLLQAANPDGEFIAMGSGYAESTTILQSIKPDSSDRFSDPDLVAAYLRYRVAMEKGSGADESRLEEASKLINERKKQSATSREQTDRAKWAKSAMKLSFATGSLELVQETLIWLRRFNRESDTIADLYSKYALRVDEVFDLLAGIAPIGSAAEYQTLAWTRDNVKKANGIVRGLLETMAMSLREPSFNAYHWRLLQDILSTAIQRRLANAEKYQERTGCSDEDLLMAVLQPTLDLLLEAERFGIKKSNERLGMDGEGGLLGDWASLVNPRSSTRLALDRLAQGRDEIWQQHRIATKPATTTLGAPWPKGLPIQKLCPAALEKVEGPLNMPYLESRAQDVVLAGGAVLKPIPESDEAREAIGPFIDCFQFALWVYLKGAKDDQDRDVRLRRAWEHATTQLTGDRMSPDEAIRFWREQFLNWLNYIPDRLESRDLEKLGLAKVQRADLPELPIEKDDSGPYEWDPCPSHEAMAKKARSLEATCLDAMLRFDFYYIPYHFGGVAYNPPSFQVPDPVVPEQKMPDIWKLGKDPRRLSPLQRDAIAAAAVEYVNSTYGSGVSIFGKLFPRSEDARYPAFYLDQDFLERASKHSSHYRMRPVYHGVPIITDRWYCLPVQIMMRLAEALMTRLAKDPDQQEPEIREILVKIIKCLARSDRPAAACSFVQKVVLQQQDDSSWHRQLFSVGFFRRLTASQASGFFGDLSSEIQERLRQPGIEDVPRNQETRARESARGRTRGRARGMTRGTTRAMAQERTLEETSADKEAKKRPFIKVTVVKMLAQVLRGADYCDRERACSVLTSLFRGSRQLDIRVAAFESLTDMLGREDEQAEETIFTFAQQDVVPVAGSLNERCPTTEKDWRAAESSDGVLPEIYEPRDPSCGPLMGAILSAQTRFPKGSTERRRWVEDVAIPALALSATNNQRFGVLFAQRQGFALPDGLLPAIPTKPQALLQRFTSAEPEFLNQNFLDAIKGYVEAQLEPHPTLGAVTKEVEGNAQLLKSDGGQHWLQIWGWKYEEFGSKTPPLGLRQTVQLLHADLPGSASSGMMVKAVQDFARDTFALLLGQSRLGELQLLWNCLGLEGGGLEICNSRVLPLFQSFIARIDALRTPQWQRDPRRQPALLPSAFALKTQVLCRRYKAYMSDIPIDKMDEYAAGVLGLVGELVNAAALYHKPDRWPLLRAEVLLSVSSARSLALGLRFAEPALSPDKEPTLGDLLRMELAGALFRKGAGCEDADDSGRVGVVLKGWAASPFEDLRLMAYDAAQERRGHLARRADATKRGAEWGEPGDDQAPFPPARSVVEDVLAAV